MDNYLLSYLMILVNKDKIPNYRKELSNLRREDNFTYQVGIYIRNTRKYIEDTMWRTGLFGGQECRIARYTQIVPNHVKQIYGVLLKSDSEMCPVHKFISIYLIAKEAKESCCLTRKPETQRFYENLVNFGILEYIPSSFMDLSLSR